MTNEELLARLILMDITYKKFGTHTTFRTGPATITYGTRYRKWSYRLNHESGAHIDIKTADEIWELYCNDEQGTTGRRP